MKLAEFAIDYVLLTNKCERDYITGKFTCVEVRCQNLLNFKFSFTKFAPRKAFFVLKRTMGYYVLHAFLPSFLCVLASIGSFWIKLQVRKNYLCFTLTIVLDCPSSSNALNCNISYTNPATSSC